MDGHRLQSPRVSPLTERNHGPVPVTLRVTAGDARRIVRALEETSVRLGGSPSGSRLASSYIRLAGVVRQQVAVLPPGLDYCATEPSLLAARDTGESSYLPFPEGSIEMLAIQTPIYAPGVPPSVRTRAVSARSRATAVSTPATGRALPWNPPPWDVL